MHHCTNGGWVMKDGELEGEGSDMIEWLTSKSKVGLRVREGWVQSSKLCELIWAWG